MTSDNAPIESVSFRLNDEQRLALLDNWRSITKRKWGILGLAVACAVVAGAVAFSLPDVFRATATVMIEPSKNKVVNIDEVYGGISQSKEYYQTQVEILKSREVALNAIKALKLWEVPEFDPRKAQDSWSAKLKKSLGMTKPTPEWTADTLAEGTLSAFQNALIVEPVRLSQLVKVSFESQDAALASRAANAVAETFINNDRESRFKLTQQASDWLQERVSGLRQKLEASERALQAYRDSQGLVSLGGSAQALNTQSITNLTEQLVQARVRRAENQGVYNEIQTVRKNGSRDYSAVAAVMRHPSVIRAKELESLAQQKVQELSKRYGPENTKMQQAQGELDGTKQNTVTQMEAVANSLVRDYEVSRATEQQMAGELGAARSSVAQVNRKEAQLAMLEREVQSNRQLYDTFMERAKETNATDNMQSLVARVVDPAPEKGEQVRPKRSQMVVIALVLGAVLGAFIAMVLEKLDNTIKGTEDAERQLAEPVLTTLPSLLNKDRFAVMRTLAESPDSIYAEAVRTGRTGLLLSSIDSPHKVYAVTSSIPAEGKSSVASGLALSMATTKRTLLIDADMRRPMIGRGLGLPPGAKGLANLCAGTADLNHCVHKVEFSALHVMPAGDIPPNPTELLHSQRFKATLEALKKHYDVIIIDTPPVELVSDALVVAPQVNGTIYVVKAMETPVPLVRKGLQKVKRIGAPLVGVVVNELDFKKAQRYHGEYSAYGKYGYGYYGYKAEEASKQA
ncbi:GumC family protein [Aquabacterium sp.]|uniref:GumC family protein n=1 Tax=Aquabacterium sp. TaxID=1872578 RepID=UPI0035B01485